MLVLQYLLPNHEFKHEESEIKVKRRYRKIVKQPVNSPIKQSEPEIELREVNFIKKPKVEISLPSWRKFIIPKMKYDDDDIEEDLSDEAFIKRHEEAEAEEQVLWDRWRKIREDEGKKIGGRSVHSGWRQPDLDPRAPRLRSQRLSSARSDASSTPGRLSPSTMEKIKEICILTSTPDKLRSSEKLLNKTSGSSQNMKRKRSIECSVNLQEQQIPVVKSPEESVRRIRRSIVSKEDSSVVTNANIENSQEASSSRILKNSNVDNSPQLQRRYEQKSYKQGFYDFANCCLL